MSAFAWQPDEKTRVSANATGLMRALCVPDFDALALCADREPQRFHQAFFRKLDLRWYRPFARVIDESRGIAWAQWCVGGATNVTLNALDRWRGTPTYDKPAVVWEGEDGARKDLSYRELDREVCRFAGALRTLGIGRGDVVAIYMPNVPEAVIAMLAVPKIGAIVMPLFSGFGADAIAVRLQTGGAKALLTIDASPRRGKAVSAKAIVDEALETAPSVEHVVVLRHLGEPPAMRAGRDHWWDDLCAGQPDDTPTEEMDAEAPYLLVFTSGTTGRPKGVVHSHIGFMAKTLIDLWLMLDCKPEDRVLWMSDMGWVVGPMMVYGVSMIGATLVLVEGAPNFPDPERMWRLIAQHRVSYLGVAPTTIRTFLAQGSEPWKTWDLSGIRVMVSSGEAWSPEAWNWTFENICRRRVPILNFSGGTEMIGIVGCTLVAPLKPAGFNCAVPGAGADVVDQTGQSTQPGIIGELVMRRPSIGLTRGLWREPERYIEIYWSTWPDVWHHGDLASRDADGHWYVHGRSDDTLKIAGKRTGPAEVESLLMGTGALAEAAAIGVPDSIKGTALVVACVPRPGVVADDALKATLSRAIVRGLGVPFQPRAVLFVPDLPKTRNMKIMRRVVRAMCSGTDPGDLSSLVNPEALDELRLLGEEIAGERASCGSKTPE